MVADPYTSEERALLLALQDAEGPTGTPPGGRVVILTDGQSNLGSLLAAGIRDGDEDMILRALCRLCGSGRLVELRFIRSHSGWVGNEVSDVVAGYVREQRELFRPGRTIALYIAKSRLQVLAQQDLKDRVLAGASSARSNAALVCAAGAALGRNPVLGESGAFNVGRRDECVYNQMRLGCSVFERGFLSWRHPGRPTVCKKCGGLGGYEHFLLTCPASAGARARLHSDAYAEKVDRDQELALRALKLGQPPPRIAPWRGLRLSTIGQQPFATLQFIRDTRAWVDTVAAPGDDDGVLPCGPVKRRALRKGR